MRKTIALLSLLALLGACSTGEESGEASPTSPATETTGGEAGETSGEGSEPQGENTDDTTATGDDGSGDGGSDDESDGNGTDDAGEGSGGGQANLPDFLVGESQSDGYPDLDGQLLGVETRIGSHDGFDRVVVEYTGTGTPNWHASYTDTPIQDGSGFPIDMPGSVFLQVSVAGMAYPDADTPQIAHRGPASTTSIAGIEYGGPFEGMNQIFVGLDEEREYRVFVEEDPTRLVIDIATDD